MLLAVPNLSEGRDRTLVFRIAQVPGVHLLDVSADPDHNRSVLTYTGPPDALVEASVEVATRAVQALDLRAHSGVHPRTGVLDVLPFVPYREGPEAAKHAGQAAARRLADEVGLPVYLYGALSPGGRDLPSLRRALRSPAPPPPDLGPPQPHAAAGVVCVGVRGPLVAFNVNLRAPLEDARAIAAAVRTRGGGLAGVRALAFELPSRGLTQVSMNLVEPATTGPRAAFEAVAAQAAARGVEVVDAEVVGLVPGDVLPELRGLPLRRLPRTIEEAAAARH